MTMMTKCVGSRLSPRRGDRPASTMTRLWGCVGLVALAASFVAAGGEQYASPSSHGGKILTNQSEPLNVIISGTSDPAVLSPDGFAAYVSSLKFDPDSFAGQSSNNDAQQANLGDGNGWMNQTGLYRKTPALMEVLQGGNHFRYWVQNGKKANTGAIFIVASIEMGLKQHHNIVPNGYDLGRDQLVGNATQAPTHSNTTEYTTKLLSMDTSLMQGVSKNDLNHKIATDGKVAVLEITTAPWRGNGASAVAMGPVLVGASLAAVASVALSL